MNLKHTYSLTKKLVSLLAVSEKSFLKTYMIITVTFALMDMVSLGLLAIGLNGLSKDSRSLTIPSLGVDVISPLLIIGIACALVILRTLGYVLYQKRAVQRFAQIEHFLGEHVFRAFALANWKARLIQNSSEVVKMTDSGVTYVVHNYLYPAVTIPSLFIGVISITLILFVSDPVLASITLFYLLGVGALLYKLVSKKSSYYGRANRNTTYESVALMSDIMKATTDIQIRNKMQDALDSVSDLRKEATFARASLTYWGGMPKFILEMALVIAMFLVGGVAWVISQDSSFISTLSVFAFAGFRLIPYLSQIQNSLAQLHSNETHVNDVYSTLTKFYVKDIVRNGLNGSVVAKESRTLRLDLKDVSFAYPDSSSLALNKITIAATMPLSLAIVGASGSGKSTLLNVILGLLPVTDGVVEVDGIDVKSDLESWHAQLGFVPQAVTIFRGSISQNVAMSWKSPIDEDRVFSALKQAGLEQMITSLPQGLITQIGEGNLALSGGEAQRMGIARALYTDPKVIVLDESTSSLDTQTESTIMQNIRSLKGDRILIAVAHRLATVKDFDVICYLKDGELIAKGTFNEVRGLVGEFDEQANLAGMN